MSEIACRALVASLILSPAVVAAQSESPVEGRWDVTATRPNGETYPSWLEVSHSGHSTYVGRFVGEGGSARPVARVTMAGDTLRFAIPPQWQRENADLRVEGIVAGDRMSGWLVNPDGSRHSWTAVRAPSLVRAKPVAWGAPVALFDGKSLAGWTTQPASRENRWKVVNGLLTGGGGGANLITTRKFDDFKLRVEFRIPKGSNSGIYLRGRYEVQIEDSPKRDLPYVGDVGAVYGFIAPTESVGRAPGEWQAFDITLVGRRLTVVLNGRTVICDQVIPGITGGALDSDEAAPGPIYIQGDHGAVEFRRIVLTPAR